MKALSKEEQLLSLFNKQMEEFRKELIGIISRASDEDDRRLDGLNWLLMIWQLDPTNFYRIWIEPLVAAGLNTEVAMACIADSYLLPN